MTPSETRTEAPYREHFKNNRTCDFARRDAEAGLHRHVVRLPEDPDIIHCVGCGKAWYSPIPGGSK